MYIYLLLYTFTFIIQYVQVLTVMRIVAQQLYQAK
jgi:hypothetical protein